MRLERMVDAVLEGHVGWCEGGLEAKGFCCAAGSSLVVFLRCYETAPRAYSRCRRYPATQLRSNNTNLAVARRPLQCRHI
jgi:hypothetical protein